MLQKISISNKCCKCEKVQFSIKQVTVFNIANNKNDFWRIMWHWEDWSNGCWIFSFTITGKKLHLKYIKIENIFSVIISNTPLYSYLLYFWSDKCSLGEHKGLVSNAYKKLLTTNFWTKMCNISIFTLGLRILDPIVCMNDYVMIGDLEQLWVRTLTLLLLLLLHEKVHDCAQESICTHDTHTILFVVQTGSIQTMLWNWNRCHQL